MSGSVSVAGTVDTELPAVAALADNTANPTAPAVGAFQELWDGATWDWAPGNSTDGALVNLGTNNDVTVASLPLPTGAATLAEQQAQTTHLATVAGDTTVIETAVQIVDDWDESDRAKVNPIVGQAGVAAGAGAVKATVQRVTLASDDPARGSTPNPGQRHFGFRNAS